MLLCPRACSCSVRPEANATDLFLATRFCPFQPARLSRRTHSLQGPYRDRKELQAPKACFGWYQPTIESPSEELPENCVREPLVGPPDFPMDRFEKPKKSPELQMSSTFYQIWWESIEQFQYIPVPWKLPRLMLFQHCFDGPKWWALWRWVRSAGSFDINRGVPKGFHYPYAFVPK